MKTHGVRDEVGQRGAPSDPDVGLVDYIQDNILNGSECT